MAGHRYEGHVTHTADGELVASFPAFPGLSVRAPTLEALHQQAADALAEHIDVLQRAHEPVVAAAGIDWRGPDAPPAPAEP